MKVSMVVTEEEEALQKSMFEVTWTDEESGVAKKAKKVRCVFELICLRQCSYLDIRKFHPPNSLLKLSTDPCFYPFPSAF